MEIDVLEEIELGWEKIDGMSPYVCDAFVMMMIHVYSIHDDDDNDEDNDDDDTCIWWWW